MVDVLIKKTRQAIECTQPASIILAGGVAANVALRDRLTKLSSAVGVPLFLPDFKFSLDNAAMIAVAGYYRALAGGYVDPLILKVDPNMDIV